MAQPQPAHHAHPTLLNLPQPPSNPDTPSEMPGTPTSTTTSLSALSTTAIKDGHRGALHHRGHQHSLSSNSLEAERADRISRLAGLSTVSTLRGAPAGFAQNNSASHQNPAFPTASLANNPAAAGGGAFTPAYFDAAGQPTAATKISTVGSASATESVGGRTTTETGGDDQDTLGEEEEDRDEDMLTEMDSASASGYMGTDALDAMDEDLDNLATQSVGGFEDRMSDDGSASLVGFGEGAGSTVSGPIYHRRPLPAQTSAMTTGGAPGPGSGGGTWGLERSGSGLSEGAAAAASVSGNMRRDLTVRPPDREGAGSDTPVSQSAVRERREARMVDGVALDSGAVAAAPASRWRAAAAADDDHVFVDTTTRGPVPVQPATSAIRETQQPHSHQQAAQAQYNMASTSAASVPSPREAAERIVRERLDDGESKVGPTAMASPKGGERLGRFYFEDR